MHHLSNYKKFLLIPVFFLLVACPMEKAAPQKSPAELIALQTRDYDTTKEQAISGVVAVLQDLGYIIQTSDFQSGLITAKSPTKANFVPFVGRRMDDTRTTGTVRKLKNGKVRVRLNFVESKRLSFGYGMKQDNERPIYDPSVYQDAFNKIRNQLFIQKKTN